MNSGYRRMLYQIVGAHKVEYRSYFCSTYKGFKIWGSLAKFWLSDINPENLPEFRIDECYIRLWLVVKWSVIFIFFKPKEGSKLEVTLPNSDWLTNPGNPPEFRRDKCERLYVLIKWNIFISVYSKKGSKFEVSLPKSNWLKSNQGIILTSW